MFQNTAPFLLERPDVNVDIWYGFDYWERNRHISEMYDICEASGTHPVDILSAQDQALLAGYVEKKGK